MPCRAHSQAAHTPRGSARARRVACRHHGTCSGSSSGRSRRGRLPAPFSVFSGMALGAAQGPLARTLGSGPVPFLGTCRALRFVKNCYIPLYRRPLVDAAPVITRPGSFYDCALCVCRVLLDICRAPVRRRHATHQVRVRPSTISEDGALRPML